MTYSERVDEIVEQETTDLRRACELWLAFFESKWTGDVEEQMEQSMHALDELRETAANEKISKHFMRRGKSIVTAVLLP